MESGRNDSGANGKVGEMTRILTLDVNRHETRGAKMPYLSHLKAIYCCNNPFIIKKKNLVKATVKISTFATCAIRENTRLIAIFPFKKPIMKRCYIIMLL